MKLNINLIKIPTFNFKQNNTIRKYIQSLIDESYDFTHIYKLIGLSTKKKIDINEILNKLEDKTIQYKIVKKLTNYNKIPLKILNYFKNNCDKKVSYEDIINEILKYLQLKYNKESIFCIDINVIYYRGWNKNELNEEGPREIIYNNLCNIKSKCIIM